jgi:class 3 adenylate cyclase
MQYTVVELDMVGFTECAHRVEKLLGPDGVKLITEQMRGFALDALREMKIDAGVIRDAAGDHMLLVFDRPDDADRFAVEFHETWAAHNAKHTDPANHYLFRLGIGTGELAAGEEVAGTTIIDAVRLEEGGQPGHVLINPATYDALSPRRRARYGQREHIRIKGKKDGDYPAHRCVVVQPSTRPSGWVSREHVRNAKSRLPDEVFAVELLRRPITLLRDAKGLTVTVNRGDVEDMLISNAGKRAAVAHYIGSRERQEELSKVDREIHAFLAGRGPDQCEINPERLGIRLRWASGGMLSIVTLAGDSSGKQWVPCFFRDIRPYGWNISLGATERAFDPQNQVEKRYSIDHELNSPWEYILREFLEESLVVADTPRRGARLPVRRFRFPDASAVAVGLSRDFDELHRTLRTQEDGFEIVPSAEHAIDVRRWRTDCTLFVEHGAGTATHTEDVLICFSVLDLGIEVIRVVEYEIAPTDTMLDGEIQAIDVRHTGRPQNELVRMPIALLSLDYLREMLHGEEPWQTYTLGPQPSLVVSRAPDPERDEIRLFEWDVERRMSILSNPAASHTQATRFLDWYDKFGPNFVDAAGRPSAARASRLFVPSTGKALNLLFERAWRP